MCAMKPSAMGFVRIAALTRLISNGSTKYQPKIIIIIKFKNIYISHKHFSIGEGFAVGAFQI
jgi:hypothetical protein